HAGFMSVGAYTAALFTINAGLPYGVSFPVALVLGGVMAALFGLVIGIPALRLKGDYLAIMTLGFGEIIRVIIINLDFTGGARGLRGIPRLTNFTAVYLVMLITLVALYALIRSRQGRAILSIREDDVAAESTGVPTTYVKVVAFTLSAFFAGVAGGLYAHYVGVLDATNFGFAKSIDILVMVVLGGMGSLTGSVVAGTLLTMLPEALRQFSDYRMLVYSILLIAMMIFRPIGLMGTNEFSLTRLFNALFHRNGRALPDVEPEKAYRAMLEVNDLGIAFGGLQALKNVSFTLDPGEIVCLIGPNGAGKTTVFNLLTAVYVPTAGTIEMNKRSLVGKATHQITEMGMARTFQNIRLFKDLTVMDNIKIGFHHQMNYSTANGVTRTGRYWTEEEEIEIRALELLKVFGLEGLAQAKAGNLPYGQQRKLEIARALATKPKILLLDEPAAGMNHTETAELMETIRLISKRFSLAILLIEHDMSLVMGICQRIIVLDYGQVIATGTPAEIQKNERVIGAYLGQ
ncbi:MAG: branched-chain amino acid ABC transporter ATP-binding protein/permease, partial [Clostridiales bacterium]|nr:branched-chain amino acid ABC transporter ATP-binding protein/permease [Clostridiales bacterium]